MQEAQQKAEAAQKEMEKLQQDCCSRLDYGTDVPCCDAVPVDWIWLLLNR